MPHTLLLADDSVTIQRVIALTFADEDVQVVAVGDGDQAIARVEAQPPDIVLADIGMPGKNGYEVAAHIKHSPRLAHIPVVLLTGAFEPLDQVKAAAAGYDGVLAKPFEPQLVITRVRELLGRPLSAPAAPAGPVPPPAPPPVQEVTPRTPELALNAVAEVSTASDYFDQLDAAFANLARPHIADLPLSYQPPAVDDRPAALTSRQSPDAVRRPVRQESESSHEATETVAVPAPPSSAPEPVSRSLVVPSMAEAFAALLEAEQKQTARPEAVGWPWQTAQPPVVTDELIDQVTERVLTRLSDRVVHDAVADHVSAVAERLVREEIDRIKAAIK